MEEKGRSQPDPAPPPGHFTSDELREQTARFLDELRRRTEKRKSKPRKKAGPPPKSG